MSAVFAVGLAVIVSCAVAGIVWLLWPRKESRTRGYMAARQKREITFHVARLARRVRRERDGEMDGADGGAWGFPLADLQVPTHAAERSGEVRSHTTARLTGVPRRALRLVR